MQLLNKDEKDLLDMLIDEGAQLVGTLDAKLVQKLYNRGLAYLEVPVKDDDYIYGISCFCVLLFINHLPWTKQRSYLLFLAQI